MDYVCNGCSASYSTERGLDWHQKVCEEYLTADTALNTVPNALEIYEQKQIRKKRKLLAMGERVELPEEIQEPQVFFCETNANESPEPEALEPLDIPPPAPILSAAGRVVRKKRLTWKLLQQLPAAPTPVPESIPTRIGNSNAEVPPSVSAVVWGAIRTTCNSFGLYREYPSIPTHNPDDTIGLQDVMDSAPPTSINEIQPPTSSRLSLAPEDPTPEVSYLPFQNSTIFGVMNWMWTGSAMKSITEMKKLLAFLKSDDFKKEDLESFDIRVETAKLDQFLKGCSNPTSTTTPEIQPTTSFPRDGWRESDVTIKVPDLLPHEPGDSPTFTVPGLLHRSIVEVIKSVFSDVGSRSFHYTPFKSFWRRSTSETENATQRVYDELYSSDAMIEAHVKLQEEPPEPGCALERVIAGMMLWSDSTHLANFGTASLWPVYLYFGNQSKWVRGKPKAAACHHIAYIPRLPSDFFDYYFNMTSNGPTEDVLTHCRRELMHAVWALLLDDEFMHAYQHGIIIECPDGVFRRFYPRIFTYSADYPEKVLLATIRNLGNCPCPRCLIPKAKIPDVGMDYDDGRRQTTSRVEKKSRLWSISRARELIYEKGLAVKSAAVERILAPESLVPTMNAFSSLSQFGFNFFSMLVPDFMHEFELGVWKALFIHLIRIMVAEGSVQELNRRYRDVPTFGRSTIRKFTENASGMKKMAARNYEDLLQCAMPVFDGLVGVQEHDDDIAALLFTVAEWHALAKLRMHTDSTLAWLKDCTKSFGSQIRRFQRHTCSFFETRELPSEEAARSRRQAKKAALNTRLYSATGRQAKASQVGASQGPPGVVPASKKLKVFSLLLIKLHALGDYVRTIIMFGTSDSYSTQPGELEHRRVKRFYARTNKNGAVRQMTRLERRENILIRLKQRRACAVPSPNRTKTNPALDFSQSEALPYTPPEFHHHISTSRNFPVHIQNFLGATSKEDPAIKDFYPKLQEHILGRILHPTWSGDGNEFSDEERNKVFIVNERLYRHKVMRVNYTTYDVRLGQDSINSRNHADIMTLSRSDEGHAFEYGRVISIFHVDVIRNAESSGIPPSPVSKQVLWVRWFKRDVSYGAGFEKKQLHRIQFLPSDDPAAFGFLDPDEVIRAAHLIPAFRYDPTDDLLKGESLGRAPGEKDDWRYFYVNIFVDRDMYMRYAGGGVGHYKLDLNEARTQGLDSTLPKNSEELLRPDSYPRDYEMETEQESYITSGVTNREGGEESRHEGEVDLELEEQGMEVDSESEEEGEFEGLEEGMDDLGAEDGEGGFEDLEDDEGYAQL